MLGERIRNQAADGDASVMPENCECEQYGKRNFLLFFLLFDDIQDFDVVLNVF